MDAGRPSGAPAPGGPLEPLLPRRSSAESAEAAASTGAEYVLEVGLDLGLWDVRVDGS